MGLFEEVVEGPKRLLRAVFEHVGVSPEVDWSRFPYDRAANQGPGTPLPPDLRRELEAMYAEPIAELEHRFGLPVAHWRPGGGTE